MLRIDKAAVVEALCARIREDLAAVTRSQQATQAGATHAESRSEHAKDTRATEASYLARGLAERAEALEASLAAVAALRPGRGHAAGSNRGAATPPPRTPTSTAGATGEAIALGALVTLEDAAGVASHYFLAPAGGGEKLALSGAEIRTLTPQSPLGRQLLGRAVGDEVTVERPRGRLEVTITSIA